jgi:hypothetical protein
MIVDKLFKKLNVWWKKLTTGFIVVYKNNKYKVVKKEGLIDPEIKYIIWAPMSSDNLLFFVYYILCKLDAKEIDHILKCNSLEYFLKDFKTFFKKSILFDGMTKQQYILKGDEKYEKMFQKRLIN